MWFINASEGPGPGDWGSGGGLKSGWLPSQARSQSLEEGGGGMSSSTRRHCSSFQSGFWPPQITAAAEWSYCDPTSRADASMCSWDRAAAGSKILECYWMEMSGDRHASSGTVVPMKSIFYDKNTPGGVCFRTSNLRQVGHPPLKPLDHQAAPDWLS